MSILFVPDYSDANPYQSNLASALGETVTYGRKSSVFPVINELLREDISLVHFHWLNLNFGENGRLKSAFLLARFLLRVLVIRILGLTVVWTVHNISTHDQPYPEFERAVVRWFVTSTCDRIIVHCEAAEDILIEDLDLPEDVRDRIDVIPHGHYLDNYENECTQREARDRLAIPQSATVFLYFGMIRRYKGVLDLVEAYRSVSIPDSRLLLAGNPVSETLHEELRDATEDDDHIIGFFEFIPDDEIQTYMNAADAVVLPFRDITTSGSTILAMSFGKALVVPELGCLPEILDEDGAILYDPETPGALRESLETATERDLAAMGAHNLSEVREFDWDDIGLQTLTTYDRAAGEPVITEQRTDLDSVAND